MRGKDPAGQCEAAGGRITPAYAGKRSRLTRHLPLPWDHPRVCGEKLAIENKVNEPQGSPPRMRGKAKVWPISTRCWGITPAYAGKRASASPALSVPWDHPRVCGEKAARPLHVAHALGSPPRMRGKGRGKTANLRGGRITPAYAGKRAGKNLAAALQGDHPRVCGEKPLLLGRVSGPLGSPPRMRGKARAHLSASPRPRITPAYAGKRLKRSRSTVSPVAIVPLFPSVCNKPVVSDGSPAGRDAPLFLPAENAVPASPAYNLRSL